jgi:DNA-binding transcriptional ArsR family regulator
MGACCTNRDQRPQTPALTWSTSSIKFNYMIEYSAGHLDRTFHALAHPVRREVIAHLAQGSASITEIAGWFDISLNGVSKHVKVLEQAGLLERTVAGRTHHVALQTERLREANEWIAYYQGFWEQRLDALQRLLEPPHDE